jgi:alcohol dehydrogenase, propanol-preferring
MVEFVKSLNYVLAGQEFTFHIPDKFDDAHAAPLFCAGVVGYRALTLSKIKKGETLAIFGFGASGYIIAQIARHWNNRLIVFTRGEEHQKMAKSLGAFWAGGPSDEPPEKADAAIITAPSGELVIDALKNVKKGGRVAIEDIYMTPIPKIDYNRYLYHERWLGSVTNYTRQDANEFLKLAAEIPIEPKIQTFGLEEANRALNLLKNGSINGAAVLKID